MSGQIHQFTQQICSSCGAGGISPQISQYYDRYTQETVTEATWVCTRCGTKFSQGEVSRVKDDKKTP